MQKRETAYCPVSASRRFRLDAREISAFEAAIGSTNRCPEGSQPEARGITRRGGRARERAKRHAIGRTRTAAVGECISKERQTTEDRAGRSLYDRAPVHNEFFVRVPWRGFFRTVCRRRRRHCCRRHCCRRHSTVLRRRCCRTIRSFSLGRSSSSNANALLCALNCLLGLCGSRRNRSNTFSILAGSVFPSSSPRPRALLSRLDRDGGFLGSVALSFSLLRLRSE